MNPNVVFNKSAFSPKDFPEDGFPEICISGRSNVGKSSLINRIGNNNGLAKVSQTPGKTRSLNYYLVDKRFFLVDLPGYGYAKVPKTERAFFEKIVDPFLHKRETLKGIIQLIDSRHGPIGGDFEMLDWIGGFGGRVLYVLTKVDKLTAQERAGARRKYGEFFGSENINLFSAKNGMGVDELWSWVYNVLDLG